MTSQAPMLFPVNYDSQFSFDREFISVMRAQDAVSCDLCGLEFWPFALTEVAQSGPGSCHAAVCAECLSAAPDEECECCSQRMLRGLGTYYDSSHNFCYDCHSDDRIVRCCSCGESSESDSDNIDACGNYACCDCRRRGRVYMCESCENWSDSTDSHDRCSSCSYDDDDECDDDSDCWPISEYHSGPANGWHVRRLPGESNAARSYGIELEVERGNCSRPLASVATDVRGTARGLFHCERDGSLSDGFEIISQPCTLAYWASSLRQGGAVRDMLDELRSKKLLSHDTSTCGLHVHIGRASLSRCTIYKLIAFADANPGYILDVSRRRNKDSLQRWAEPSIGKAAVCYSAKQLARKGIVSSCNSERYVAVNVCRNTVEIRIFRGSLIPATVLGAIQWCDALIEWCTVSTLATVSAAHSWQNFAAYAAASPTLANRAELAQSDLYCRQYASRPKLQKGAAA